MDVIAELREMTPNDVWFIRLFFCPETNRTMGEIEQYSIEGNLYRNFTFPDGESRENVFHAVNTRAPHSDGHLTVDDDGGQIYFNYSEQLDRFEWENGTQYVQTPCRVEVLSRTPRTTMGSTGGSMDGNLQLSKSAPVKLLF